ncbi:MAG TPA: spore protease YyaC [Clostridiales bacterium]|nr:spore protease YyaC [Clostridiales bacterium]
MFIKTSVEKHFIDINSPGAFHYFADVLYKLICKDISDGYKSIVFVCIGTDRSTGDSLGPLIGHKIMNMNNRKNISVYGTLENPVHAKNLSKVMEDININCINPFIIAIDACLGKMEHVGFVSIGEGPINPGSALKKELPPIGNIHIVGIVNLGGFMDFLILQNTRLFLVMKMADLIAGGIKHVLWRIQKDPFLF